GTRVAPARAPSTSGPAAARRSPPGRSRPARGSAGRGRPRAGKPAPARRPRPGAARLPAGEPPPARARPPGAAPPVRPAPGPQAAARAGHRRTSGTGGCRRGGWPSSRGRTSPGAPAGGALRLQQEERLAELDGLGVLDQHPDDAARHLRLDLVHELHRLDDADDLALLHPVALADERLRVGSRRPVEGADQRRLDRQEVGLGGRGGRREGAGARDRRRAGRRRGGSGCPVRDPGRRLPAEAHPDALALELHLRQAVLAEEVGQAAELPVVHRQARSMYAPVRVSIRRTSPSSMNRGTWTTAPVSSVAGFEPPDAVSPRRPGSVRTTASSTKFGTSTPTGSPLMSRTSTSMVSLSQFAASPTTAGSSAICS